MKLVLNVDQLRKERGLNYSQLAKGLGMSWRAAKKLCTEPERRSVYLKTLDDLSRFLGCDIGELFTHIENEADIKEREGLKQMEIYFDDRL